MRRSINQGKGSCMPRTALERMAITCLLAMWMASPSVSVGVSRATAGNGPAAEQMAAAFGQLPLVFEENRGQALASITHVSRGPGYQIQIAPPEAIVTLVRVDKNSSLAEPRLLRQNVRMQFSGGNTR